MIKGSDLSDLNIAEEHLSACQSQTQKFLQHSPTSKHSHSPFRNSESSPVFNVKVDVNINIKQSKFSPKRLKNKDEKQVEQETRVQKKRVLMDLLMCLSLINFEWREWQDVID